jgi:hypothetical protein
MSNIDLGHPARGLAYIRHITTVENYANSPIVIPVQARNKLSKQQFIVVNVGKYERCEDEDCRRLHNKWNQHVHRLMMGDWVLVRNRSWSLTPDPDVYVVRQDAILGKFEER